MNYNVVHVINDTNTGGAERQLLKVLASSKCRQNYLILSLRGKGLVAKEIEELNIPVISLNLNVFNFPIKFVVAFLLFRRHKPSVIHAWMYHSNLFCGLLSFFLRNMKLVWSIHHNDLSLRFNKFTTIFIAWLGAKLSYIIPVRIICVSSVSLQTHLDFGYNSNRMCVVNNGVNTEEFKYNSLSRVKVREQLMLTDKSLLIGFFARYDPLKNIEGFLKACKIVIDEQNDLPIKILIAGSLMDANNYKLVSLLESIGLNDYTFLLGVRNDMPDLYSSIDVFVNYSFNESFSLVLAEAMSCQVTCISNISGDPCNILGDYGIRKNFESHMDLATAISKVLKINHHDRLSLGLYARRRIELSYNLEQTIKGYESIYWHNIITA
jgi:glycosyltransferase involved in cell wall biosynthesis